MGQRGLAEMHERGPSGERVGEAGDPPAGLPGPRLALPGPDRGVDEHGGEHPEGGVGDGEERGRRPGAGDEHERSQVPEEAQEGGHQGQAVVPSDAGEVPARVLDDHRQQHEVEGGAGQEADAVQDRDEVLGRHWRLWPRVSHAPAQPMRKPAPSERSQTRVRRHARRVGRSRLVARPGPLAGAGRPVVRSGRTGRSWAAETLCATWRPCGICVSPCGKCERTRS